MFKSIASLNFIAICLHVHVDVGQAILAATTGASYRPDLAKLAVARYHALARGINNAKRGISKQ